MIASLSGAIELPSPVTSEVIPWKIFDGSRGSTRIVISDCPSISINPGATTFPPASIVRLRGAADRFPIAAILPSRIPTSPEYHGDSVPSMMCPLRNHKIEPRCLAVNGTHQQPEETTKQNHHEPKCNQTFQGCLLRPLAKPASNNRDANWFLAPL